MRRRTRRWGALGLLGLGATLFPRPAKAGSELGKWFISPGVVWSRDGDERTARGFELSVGRIDWDQSLVHVGLVYRNMLFESAPLNPVRRTIFAVEGGYGPLGLELGVVRRDEDGLKEGKTAGHLALYLSGGFLYVGPQLMVGNGTPELQLNFGLKVPIPHIVIPFLLLGTNWGSMGRSGRALRDLQGVVQQADLISSSPPDGSFKAWVGSAPRATERPGKFARCTPLLRRRLALCRKRVTREEHAAIGSFVYLARDLLHLNAPLDLVKRAMLSAQQEVEHTQAAVAVFTQPQPESRHQATQSQADNSCGARETRFGPLPLVAYGKTVSQVLSEAVLDGMVGEGLAQRELRIGRQFRLAREEANHAALCREVVLFLLDSGSPGERQTRKQAVMALLRGLPPPAVRRGPAAGKARFLGRVRSELARLLSRPSV